MADPPQHHQHHKDSACEICGDIGYEVAIQVCCKCRITREHRYCMKRLHEGKGWVCEECKPKGQIPSLKPGKQLCHTGTKLGSRKPPQNTKVQYISIEEAKVLESGALKRPSPIKITRRPIPTAIPKMKEIPVVQKQHGRQEFLAKKTQASNATAEKEKRGPVQQLESSIPKLYPPHKISNPSAGSNTRDSEHKSPQLLQCSPAVKPDRGRARQLWQESPTANLIVSEHSAHTSRRLVEGSPSPSSDKGSMQRVYKETCVGNSSHLKAVSTSDAERRMNSLGHASVKPDELLPAASLGLTVADMQPKNTDPDGWKASVGALNLDRYLSNHPSDSPTWKGRFDIIHEFFDHKSFNGIQAHPPCKVHRKVYDLSKQLPEALQFELLPRLNFWSKLFQDDTPGALDIGLYFFSSTRPEQSYSPLLNCLDGHDMLLRSRIDTVDLLIFSSRHLPENSQRINQNYYLWGLFFSTEDTAVASEMTQMAMVSLGQEPWSPAEDMDIDMAGGSEVGIVDKVVRRPDASTNSKDNHSVLPKEDMDIVMAGRSEVGIVDKVLPRPDASTDSKDNQAGLRKEETLGKTESYLDDPFNRDLQNYFDRFIKITQDLEEPKGLKEVKEEPGSPWRR